jgi:hypothetical protein
MPKKTDRLRSYVEVLKDRDRELRATLVEVLQEEDAIGRASGANSSSLAKKYDMNSMGGQ